MLRRPAVVPRYEDRPDTRSQLVQQADRRYSLTPPSAEVTGVRSRIPRSLDPTHSFPNSIRQLAVSNFLSVQSRWLILEQRMLDRD